MIRVRETSGQWQLHSAVQMILLQIKMTTRNTFHVRVTREHTRTHTHSSADFLPQPSRLRQCAARRRSSSVTGISCMPAAASSPGVALSSCWLSPGGPLYMKAGMSTR